MMNKKAMAVSLIIVLLMIGAWVSPSRGQEEMPDTFVDITRIIPDVLLEIRYYGEHNFLGAKVDGYLAPKCLLTKPAAMALAAVQKDLKPFSLSLKIYDCYRPQQAVDHFVRWAKDLDDTKTKQEFYPSVDKRHLFRDGYIDSRSGHSRGSTVDLTLVPLPPPAQPVYVSGEPLKDCRLPSGERFADNAIDMRTGFDCFDPLSHPENPQVALPQRINRLLLKTLMEKHGFRHYDKEWWHFTYKQEPYPDTYFNFPVK
ncbi:MAG: M15 family metallopeptidase [Smithellaceae bacterium]